ncbi:MAG: dNTP triphosphohydrolase [Lachnospiraceae bacterium]|nr:dNTP triphosphohydrolase [Lachnospiraceae bacterium]
MSITNYLSTKRLYQTSNEYEKFDQRTDFQKDYHSIISSSAFRRLQDKTQVFPLDKSDYVRTRLTHSLEVASIGRSLVQSSCKYFSFKNYPTNEELKLTKNENDISDIIQCAGLLHDIGNPPFGHFGEDVIGKWFETNLKIIEKNSNIQLTEQMKQDLIHFEGNAQALRIIIRLQNISKNSSSNLTSAVINSIIKYPIPSTQVQKDGDVSYYHKFGYFSSEEFWIKKLIKNTGYDQKRCPLTYILEAADDIAYRMADLDDAFKKGLITYRQLYYELENNNYLDFSDSDKYKHLQMSYEEFSSPKDCTSASKESDLLKYWLNGVQSKLIAAATYTFTFNFDEILQGTYPNDLFDNSHSHYLIRFLKDIAVKYIFDSPELLKLEVAASEILQFLLDKFCFAIIDYNPLDDTTPANGLDRKLCNLISDNYKEVCKDEFNWLEIQSFDAETKKAYQLYFKFLLVTDFISGMTDSYAKSLYQELKGFYL